MDKEIQLISLKGNQSINQAKAPVFWSPDVNSWLIGKVPHARKDWGQKEKRVSEDEMAGWHPHCNGYDLGQTSEDSQGQGGLASCSPWGHKELDITGPLNNNNNNNTLFYVHDNLPTFKWKWPHDKSCGKLWGQRTMSLLTLSLARRKAGQWVERRSVNQAPKSFMRGAY